MFTILLADENIDNLTNLKNYLLDDFSVSIVCESDADNTLSAYNTVKPDILVINSNLTNNGCNRILNELSSSSLDDNNPNVIVSLDKNNNDISNIKHYSKVYQIFYQPMKYKHLKNIIKEFAFTHNLVVRELDYLYIRNLFSKLNFSLCSKGTKYLMYAINECYKNLDLLEGNLKDIYNQIGEHFHTNSVRSSIRSSLRYFNQNKDKISINELLLCFKDKNVTPKYFIEIVTTYVFNEKNKG